MTVMTNSFTFPNGLKETLDDVFDTYFNKPEQYSKVFKMETSEDAYEDDMMIQGPDVIPASSENGLYHRLDIDFVRTKRYLHGEFKGEIKVTKPALKDFKYKLLTDAAEHLGKSFRKTIEIMGAAFWYNGFTSEQSPDGLSVFNTAHAIANPSAGNPTTFSNRGSAALSGEALEDAVESMIKTVDEHGTLAPCMPKQLIVPPGLWYQAKRIIQSAQQAGTANNDKNVVGEDLQLIKLDFLAGAPSYADSMWFLRDPEEAKNKFYWRQKPETDVVRDPDTGGFLYQIDFRFSLGCSDYRGLYGSTGA